MSDLVNLIKDIKPKFEDLAKIHGVLNYQAEAGFAMQSLMKNKFLASVASSNPDSLKFAILNQASMGLSLNPGLGLCYLIPRDKQIVFDVSYRGLIFLATEAGALRWAQARIVYKNDNFVIRGVSQEPEHTSDPFGDRGEMVGCYCVAKTVEGDFLTTTMSKKEIDDIMKRSVSYKAYLNRGINCPWVTDYEEMAKKTVVRRSAKLWPMSSQEDRFFAAMGYLNEHQGIDLDDAREAIKAAKWEGDEAIEIEENYREQAPVTNGPNYVCEFGSLRGSKLKDIDRDYLEDYVEKTKDKISRDKYNGNVKNATKQIAIIEDYLENH